MGYSENPFNSEKGKKIVKDIFNLMFISPQGSPSKIESKDKQRQVSHYKGNIVNIVNKMRKFVKGYQQVIISETASSGIHICPHCHRRDAIWMWETVDAGHYASPYDWLSSVALTTWEYGAADEIGRYQFVVRYRCNDVTTCNKCRITVAGKYTSCKSCNSSDISQVGCGEESYATHFIKEYTADDNHPQAKDEASGAIDRNRQWWITKDGKRDLVTGDISGYEFQHKIVPNGKVVTSWSDIKEYLPSVQFTYTDSNTGSTKERLYPVSELNYAVSKQNMVICVMGAIGVGGVCDHAGQTPELQKYGEPLDACRLCHATDYPPLLEVQDLYYKPHPMKIMNSQPLSPATSVGGTYKRKPVYNLYLESPKSDIYKLLLPLPQILTLNPIPTEAKISSFSSAPNSCPNDVGAGAAETKSIKEANEKLQEVQEELLKKLTGVKSLGDADGQTNKGFTFDVCEGRSRKAYYQDSKWIDDSPPCYSYRKDGVTLNKRRKYPRWSKIPSYSPEALPDTHYHEYLGPNPDTHFVMDWIKANQTLAAFIESPPTYHSVVKIAETIDKDMGLIYEVLECKTCKKIVEAGGVIPYRQGFSQCDEQGQAINNFPQVVLDAEMSFEKSYPTKNTKGEPVMTAWGIKATKKHDGKKMLLNPDLNIRIG